MDLLILFIGLLIMAQRHKETNFGSIDEITVTQSSEVIHILFLDSSHHLRNLNHQHTRDDIGPTLLGILLQLILDIDGEERRDHIIVVGRHEDWEASLTIGILGQRINHLSMALIGHIMVKDEDHMRPMIGAVIMLSGIDISLMHQSSTIQTIAFLDLVGDLFTSLHIHQDIGISGLLIDLLHDLGQILIAVGGDHCDVIDGIK